MASQTFNAGKSPCTQWRSRCERSGADRRISLFFSLERVGAGTSHGTANGVVMLISSVIQRLGDGTKHSNDISHSAKGAGDRETTGRRARLPFQTPQLRKGLPGFTICALNAEARKRS